MLSEAAGGTTPGCAEFQKITSTALAFPPRISAGIDESMLGAHRLRRAHGVRHLPCRHRRGQTRHRTRHRGADGSRLPRRRSRCSVATRNAEVPANLRMGSLHLPTAFIVRCWPTVLAGPRGELWLRSPRPRCPRRNARFGRPTPDRPPSPRPTNSEPRRVALPSRVLTPLTLAVGRCFFSWRQSPSR